MNVIDKLKAIEPTEDPSPSERLAVESARAERMNPKDQNMPEDVGVFPVKFAQRVHELLTPQTIGLGDIVSLGFNDGEYDCATVCQIHTDGTVDLFRPYTHTADFSYTGGVICYVGIENISRANPNRLRLIRKGPPLK